MDAGVRADLGSRPGGADGGITGASLYNAFGDKRSLYRQAFVHYLAQTVRDRVARLEKLPPAAAIRGFFDEIIDRSVDDEQRRGCMLGGRQAGMSPFGAGPAKRNVPADLAEKALGESSEFGLSSL